MLKPNSTIGIVGGGQLGRMLALSATRLGFRTAILDPDENAPAFQVASVSIIGAYDDISALKQLSELSDVITYEFENVPVEAFDALSEDIQIHPNTKALRTSQDRLVEKTFFNDIGIATAPFYDCPTGEDLDEALAQTGGKGILKTRRFGYDGKGQVRLSPEKPEAIDEAKQVIAVSPSILEGFIEFEREISIIASQGAHGMAFFDVAENVHRDGILYTSTVPANISYHTANIAKEMAAKVLAALDYIGVIGIEFFLLKDGSLIANEFAPRVHNSGHWTEATCSTSQFEQHIRAISGISLGSTNRHSNCRMENLIGDEIDKTPEILEMSDTILHLYGKQEKRPGRKMGHFTTISPIKA